jgi:thiamine-phosphate pyrophosphorylase
MPEPPFLYPIVDTSLLRGRGVADVVSRLCRGGARLLQLRAKGLPDQQLLRLVGEALGAARAAGARLVVNDRADVACLAGADGVHVGQEDLPPSAVRRVTPGGLLGVSTHNVEQVRAAAEEPVDYVAVGPVFPTRSKEKPDPVVGLDLLRQARPLVRRPLVAIGGITLERAASVVAAGADGVAVISDLLREDDLESAVQAWQAALRSGP